MLQAMTLSTATLTLDAAHVDMFLTFTVVVPSQIAPQHRFALRDPRTCHPGRELQAHGRVQGARGDGDHDGVIPEGPQVVQADAPQRGTCGQGSWGSAPALG